MFSNRREYNLSNNILDLIFSNQYSLIISSCVRIKVKDLCSIEKQAPKKKEYTDASNWTIGLSSDALLIVLFATHCTDRLYFVDVGLIGVRFPAAYCANNLELVSSLECFFLQVFP